MEIYEARCALGKPYEWKVIENKNYLVNTSAINEVVLYDPLIQTPDLYLKFGQLKVTELEILEFVKIYGDLGAGSKFIKGTNYLAWEMSWLRKEIKDFRTAINGWADASKHLYAENVEDNRWSEWFKDNRWNEWAPIIGQRVEQYVKAMILVNPVRSVWLVRGAIPVAWLQLWMAIGKQAPVAQCSECTNIFELAPTRRFKKKFCSDSCKQKSWRKNRK
ncbi:hypothetical protein OAB85_01135 [Pseudomonadales bacterium]|nr:hypothetical protein [Pseudomonadales bacterium]